MRDIGSRAVSIVLAALAAACNSGEANTSGNAAAPANAAQPAANNAAPAPVPAAAADLDGARRLIDAIYTPYTRGETGSPSRTFTPELAAAIGRASLETLEADPFCDCQDFERLVYSIQSVEPAEGGAVARVAVDNNGDERVIVIRLVQRDGRWMVADVGEGSNTLLRRLAG